MLDCQKQRFSLPDGAHYLNCAYMGPLSRRTEEAGLAGVRLKSDPTRIPPESFFTGAQAVRARFARLAGVVDPQRIAIVPAVSYGMAIVARNVPVHNGQSIVVAHEQFPSNVYPWRRVAEETGAEVIAVAAPEGSTRRGEAWNERILQAIDSRTALVALPNVHWADGTRFDLAAVGERARAVGAAFVVDATQSLGAMPLDLARIRPDALVAAGYKWLLGPYGVAMAYLGPRFDHGVPLEENWINRAGSEDFSALVRYRDDYQPGALRYDMGERANPVLLPMMAAALDEIHEWRPDRIQSYCGALMQDALDEARTLGYPVEDPAWRGLHLFGIRLPAGLDAGAVRSALEANRVAVSLRGDAVRVAPNVYNDAADVEALMAALRQAARAARLPITT
jgi:selenocysteine lyase/cysteine desulfurase